MEKPRLVSVGKITRPHGVRGAVKIYPYGETLGSREAGDGLIVQSAHTGGERKTLIVESIKPQGSLWVARFSGVSSRENAEGLAGAEVYIPEDQLPATEDGEYYYYQLIGLTVETRAGRILGKLMSVMEAGANDIYIVERDGREILIPAVEDFICEVDLERARMVVDPPEGLIDDL